ncbi:MFS transporter [Candidatus Woesearchaeota archaeon]|nr:MFS transporter [Candidatus Woesearchaeota archaeon]
MDFLKLPRKISKIEEFSIIVFTLSFAISLVDTYWAVYLYQYTGSEIYVGLISTLFTVVSLVSFLVLIPIFEKYDTSRLYQWSIFLMGICYILFLFTQSLWVIVLLGVILSILTVVRINCFGIILRENSKGPELAKNVGMTFTIMNLGWLIGPLVAAALAETYGIPLLFLLSGFFFFLALFSYKFLHLGVKKKICSPSQKNFFEAIRIFFQDKDLVRSYIVSGASPIWWAFIYVYMPIYILERGLGVQWIAYFLFAVIVPVVTLEYYFNVLADKLKYRKPFVYGNIFLAFILVLAFFISNIYILFGILVLGSIGIALVEPSAESYFFLIAPRKKLERNYSIYNTSLDTFAILGKLIVAGSLLILSFSYAFLVLALLFLFFAWISLSLKQVSGVKDKKGEKLL